MAHCLLMFSGGLDSTVAAHLLTSQNISVTALHFILPFRSGLGYDHSRIRGMADKLGMPIMVVEEGDEFLEMVRAPQFGYGRNANPCLDCRIHRLSKAAAIMRAQGFDFVATGEVLNQRPMSQRRECLGMVIRRSGLQGLLVRPLSARLLKPTLPEEQGLLDRSRLLDISGRGRHRQIEYARQHNLHISQPGGGCLLTEIETARRFTDLRHHDPDFSLSDFKMLGYGRHFRLGAATRLIMGRNDGENTVLEKLAGPSDAVVLMSDVPGPLGVIRGQLTDALMAQACSMVAHYSKERDASNCRVTVTLHGQETMLSVAPATQEACDGLRVRDDVVSTGA